MRMRYRHVTYRYIDGSPTQLARHYHQLLQDALRQSQQSLLHRSATWRPPADILESAERMTVQVERMPMPSFNQPAAIKGKGTAKQGDKQP